MSVNFPANPTIGDVFGAAGRSWTWDGTAWNVTVPTVSAAKIQDADNDTRVVVEQSGDDDTIRFETAGVERATISADGTVTVFGSTVLGGGASVGGHLIPDTNELYDLGAPSARFRDLYLSGTTIDLGGMRLSSDGSSLSMTPSGGAPADPLATESFVSTAVSNLVDSAPEALNTLNELAAALGDDANYASTVTTALAGKLDKSGGSITGDLTVDTNTLHVDSTNNRVGIGTDTPLGDLSISGPGGREISFLDSAVANVAEMRAHAIGNLSNYAFMQYNAYDHRFAIEGTEVVRVNNNGYLDVDTTIDFTGTTASAGNILMSFPHSYALYVDNTGAGTDNTRLWIDAPNQGEIILGPRSGGSTLGVFRLRSAKMQLEGQVFAGYKMQTGQYSFTQEPWAASTIALGDYGYIGTAGSYGTSLLWNWERGPDSGYYSLGVNGSTAAAAIHMRNDGIRFQYESSWGATAEPFVHTLMTETETLSYKDYRIYNGTPTLTLTDSNYTGGSDGSIFFRDQANTILASVRMNGNDDFSIRAELASSTLYFWSGGNWRFYMTSTQWLPYADNVYDLGTTSRRYDDIYATNTSIISTSDARDKTDVVDIDYGLDFINSLRPVNYRWNDRSGYVGTRTHMGFIAQEVSETLGDDAANRALWIDAPAGEYKNADTGEYEPGVERQGLRYSELIAPMVKAIQELTARIDALEAN